jgi:hypothetical protein
LHRTTTEHFVNNDYTTTEWCFSVLSNNCFHHGK